MNVSSRRYIVPTKHPICWECVAVWTAALVIAAYEVGYVWSLIRRVTQ